MSEKTQRRSAARLGGRRVLISGAGSGIGRSVALRLAREGAKVGVVDIRREAADAVCAEIRAEGGSGMAEQCDVGASDDVARSVASVSDGLGGIDTLITCAGIAFPAHTHQTTVHEWESVIRVNLTGVFHATRHALPHLLANHASAIVTIGSIASLVAAGNNSAYEASKGGVLQFTRAVAVEYADRGLRANCICPGLIQTDLAQNTKSIIGDTGLADRPLIADRVQAPLPGRASPEVIAAAASYLCSDDASFVTGVALPVDGGYTAM